MSRPSPCWKESGSPRSRGGSKRPEVSRQSNDLALRVYWRFGTLYRRTEQRQGTGCSSAEGAERNASRLGWAALMIKSELVAHIAGQNPHLYQRDVENIVNAILNEITAS